MVEGAVGFDPAYGHLFSRISILSARADLWVVVIVAHCDRSCASCHDICRFCIEASLTPEGQFGVACTWAVGIDVHKVGVGSHPATEGRQTHVAAVGQVEGGASSRESAGCRIGVLSVCTQGFDIYVVNGGSGESADHKIGGGGSKGRSAAANKPGRTIFDLIALGGGQRIG